MSNALILGVNGQDGTQLARNLMRRGYRVIGSGRQLTLRHLAPAPGFEYRSLELKDTEALCTLLKETSPDVVFHVAAVHGAAGFSYETVWQDTLQVNTRTVHAILEHARTYQPNLKLVYASSSKVFGTILPRVVTERSKMSTTCLYSLTKNASRELIDYYRQNHGIKASVLFLFNHESEFRPAHFFIPRVVRALSEALNGSSEIVEVATLNFRCDWGVAEEYMDLAIDVSENACDTDFVVGTGKTWTGYRFVRSLFARHGLDYRSFVRERLSDVQRPPQFQVSTKKLESAIGRKPQCSILDLCESMLTTLEVL